jgi:hypothetical protein
MTVRVLTRLYTSRGESAPSATSNAEHIREATTLPIKSNREQLRRITKVHE